MTALQNVLSINYFYMTLCDIRKKQQCHHYLCMKNMQIVLLLNPHIRLCLFLLFPRKKCTISVFFS